MKKLAAVLVFLMVLVCAVFADTTSSELRITLTIEAIPPTFKLFGSLENAAASSSMTEAQAVDSAGSATTGLSLDDNSILSGPVSVYCVIKQTNAAKYSGTATISISATAFEDSNHTTSAATVSTLTAMNNNAARTVTGSAGSASIAYTGAASAAADIASFNVQYAQADLIPGTYSSFITMTFEAP